MRREERMTVQGPVKEQQQDGMSHRGVLQPSEWPGFFPEVDLQQAREIPWG